MQELKIVTHNGVFHADEIVAISLLGLAGYQVDVERVNHQTDLDNLEFDMAIDISRKYDGIKYFDHHQGIRDKASAGLILDYLESSNLLPKVDKIRKIVKIVDDNDNGISKGSIDSFITIIKYANQENIYSEAQDRQFYKTVKFIANHLLKPMLEEHNKFEEVKELYKDIESKTVVVLPEYHLLWDTVFNGETTPNTEAVVWYDKFSKSWKIQTTPKYPGSFERVGRPLKYMKGMVFIHPEAFFAVAPDKETMDKYIKYCFGN